LREEIEAENEGIVIPTQVRWLANPRTISERRQNGEIAASSVVLVVKGSSVAQRVVKKDIKVAGVWYHVETYTNEGPGSRCELCRGWGHIENKCGSKAKCGSCSGHHRTSDHKCNVVGCTAMQGSLWGHRLEKCPNCKGNHNAFSGRWMKKTEAIEAARQSRKLGLAGRASTSADRDMATATGAYRAALGPRPQGVADAWGDGDEEEMADVDEEEEAAGGAGDITMAEIETATRTATAIETETEMGALASTD